MMWLIVVGGIVLGAVLGARWRHRRESRPLLSSEHDTATATHIRMVADSIGEVVAISDEDGTVRYLSPSVERVLGHRRADLVGTRLHRDLSHPDELEDVNSALASVGEGVSALFAWRCRRRDGTWIWLETQAVLVRGSPEGAPQLLTVSRNIERRKTAEASLREVEMARRALVDRASFGIFRAALSGELIDANPAMARLLGRSEPRELVGLRLQSAVLGDEAQRARWLADVAHDQLGEWYDQTWIGAGGTLLRIRLSARMARDAHGRPQFIEGIAENVTERLRSEEVARRAERMASLSRTLGGIAHEINNPLAAIGGLAQILLRQPNTPERRALETMLNESRRAARVVKDLATIARRQEGGHHEPVDVNAVVSYIVGVQRYHAETRGIAIDVALDAARPFVMGDLAQLEQVILHLVVNARQAIELRQAASAADDGDPPRWGIAIHTIGREDTVVICVSDSGAGIPDTDLALIWEPFWTRRDEGEGSGLGLAVVDSIVASHRGRIEVESTEQRGSHFTITLPRLLDPPSTESELPIPTAGFAQRPLDLLVVDDEPALRDLLVRLFSSRGHAVVVADSGSEAMRLAAQVAFDVVICDLHMPGLDGRTVVRRMRDSFRERTTRYFLASGDAALGASAPDISALGVEAVIDKPYNLDAVVALVEQASPPGAAA